MALYPIRVFPDPVLRAKAAAVTDFGPDLARLADDMYRNERIPFLDSASMSVEELATSLMHKTGLQRHF